MHNHTSILFFCSSTYCWSYVNCLPSPPYNTVILNIPADLRTQVLCREWAPQTCMGLVAATERRRMLSGCYRMLASAVRMAAEGGVLQSSGWRGTIPTLQPRMCWQLLCTWQQTEDCCSLHSVQHSSCRALCAAAESAGQMLGSLAASTAGGLVFPDVSYPTYRHS